MKKQRSALTTLLLVVSTLFSFRTATITVYVVASAIGDQYAYFSNVVSADTDKHCTENGPSATGYSGSKWNCTDYFMEALKDQITIDYSDDKSRSRRTEVKVFTSYSEASDYRRSYMARVKDIGRTLRTVSL